MYSHISQENNELYLEQLYDDIDNDLSSMNDIIKRIGSKNDTIQCRREFAMLQIEVHRKLMKAAKETIDLSLNDRYIAQVQNKTDSLRSVVETAIE